MSSLFNATADAAARARHSARNAPGWDRSHNAAIEAKPGKAPQCSWAYRIEHAELGRTINALSRPEYDLVYIALYNDRLFDLRDQFKFDLLSGVHPLHGHPLLLGNKLPHHKGSLAIANELDLLKHHPKIFRPVPTHEDGGHWEALPMLGDFLLFLIDDEGPYCVHFDIKNAAADHGQPGPGANSLRQSSRRRLNAAAKLRIKAQYLSELSIRVAYLHRGIADRHVADNLRFLFHWTVRPCALEPTARADLIEMFRQNLQDGTPPSLTIADCASRWGWLAEECLRVLFQAIWRRELRVNLFDAVLVDRPLEPETVDVLDVYADWFGR